MSCIVWIVAPSRKYLDDIAGRIAQALSPIVPHDYEVIASLGEIVFGSCGYPFTDNVLDNCALSPATPTEDVIARVAENLLDALQQDMTMDLKVPWPLVVGKSLGFFAAPMAKAEDGTLHLGFEVDGHSLLRAEVSLAQLE